MKNGLTGSTASRSLVYMPVQRKGQSAPQSAPNPEVLARPKRRRFSQNYKHRIVQEAAACAEPGRIGALLRREGRDDEAGCLRRAEPTHETHTTDPVCGRFVSEDPGHSSKNWYTYCANNPVLLVDRCGLEGDLPSLTVGMDGSVTAEGVGGSVDVELMVMQEDCAVVRIDMAQATQVGRMRIGTTPNMLRGWASENGINNIILRAVSDSQQGARAYRAVLLLITRMGTRVRSFRTGRSLGFTGACEGRKEEAE